MKFTNMKRPFLAALLAFPLIPTSVGFCVETGVSAVDSQRQQLNDLFSRQWVAASESGDIRGNVVGLIPGDKAGLGDVPVFLVSSNKVTHKTRTNAEGGFTLTGVAPGAYSLVVRNSNAIGAFALHVLDHSAGKHLTSDVEVKLIKPAEMASTILREQTLPAYAMNVGSSSQMKTDPLGNARTFAQSQAVRLDGNKLVGQLSVVDNKNDLSDMMVYVLKNGIEVAKVPVSADGDYSVEGLEPGIYGLIAAGESGFAATSFELISGDESSMTSKGEKFVGLFKRACNKLNVECVPCCEVNVCEVETVAVETVGAADTCCGEVPLETAPLAPACGCGGFGGGPGFGYGGGGGGGGGGFGAGGWAGLAGIAGLATVAGIVASNDDDESPIASGVGP